MKYVYALVLATLLIVAFNAEPTLGQLSILKPSQGGTGIGSASTIGDCLKVLTTTPFAFELSSCGTGGGGGSGVGWATNTPSTVLYNTTGQQVLLSSGGGDSSTSTLGLLELSGTATTTIAFNTSLNPVYRTGINFLENAGASMSFLYNGIGSLGANKLTIVDDSASSSVIELVTFRRDGKVGIGSTTPTAQLVVGGETIASNYTATATNATSTFPFAHISSALGIFGKLFDGLGNQGTSGQLLQSTGSGVEWVSTSTLGITGGTGSVNENFGTTSIDTEAELENLLTDVANVFTNNDGTLADDDLTNNQIDDLSDVAALSETTGDLLQWNGSAWVDVATNTLGIDSNLSFSTGLQRVTNAVSCITATWSVFGCLSTSDYATFQNKISSTSLSFTDSGRIDGTYTPSTGVFTADVVSDSITDTQLAFNTGQNLTTTSDVQFSEATTTAFFSTVASSTLSFMQSLLAKDATTTNLSVGGQLSFAGTSGTTWSAFCTAITGGAGLCDGTDDGGSGGGTDGNWVWNSVSNFLRLATSTNDVAIGSNSTSTAPFFFDVSESTLSIGTSTSNPPAAITATYSRLASTTLTASTTMQDATTTTFAVTAIPNCDSVDTDANGTLKCGTDATGGGGSAFGQGWELNTSGQLAPTTTKEVAVNSLVATGTATSTFTGGLQAVGAYLTSFFTLGADTIRDITGSGLSIVGDALTCTTATWSVFGCLSTADYAIFQNKISSTSLSWTDSSQIDGTYTSATGVFTASVVADSIGDTQLAFNTGQNLTTTSDVQFSEATTSRSFSSLSSSTNLIAGGATTTTFFSEIASSTRGFFTNLLAKHATTTSLAITGALNCDSLDTDSSGNVVCGTDASGGGGGVSDWVKETTFGALALTPTTTIPVWFKDAIYASTTLDLRAHRFSQHNLGFIDLQRTGSDFTLMRIRAPRGDSNEATLSLVNDLSATDTGVDEEFVDVYNERYEDSLQWGLRQAHSGTGIAKPFVIGHWNTALGKDIGNKLIVMPSGAVAITQATATIPNIPFYVASSTATTLARFDTTPGTPKFAIGTSGDISLSGASGNLTINPNLDGGQYNIGVDTSGTLAIFGSGAQFLNLNMLDGTFTNASGTTLNHATATRLFSTFASSTNLVSGGATTTQFFSTIASSTNLFSSLGTFFDMLRIPFGTAPTVDAVGEIALDTTDDQLIVADSTGTARVFATDEKKVKDMTIASTSVAFVSGGVLPIGAYKDGIELTQYRCYVSGGTSVVLNLSDGTNDTETITCNTTVSSDTDVATNDTFTADEIMNLEFGTITGTVNYVHFEAYARITRE